MKFTLGHLFIIAVVAAAGCVTPPTSGSHGTEDVRYGGYVYAYQHANSTILDIVVLEFPSQNVSFNDSDRLARAFIDKLDRVEALAVDVIMQDNSSRHVVAENVTIDRASARISAELPATRFMSLSADARFVLKNGTILTPRDMVDWKAGTTKRWYGSLDFHTPPNTNLTSVSLLIYEAKPGTHGFSNVGDDSSNVTRLKAPRIREIQNWSVTAHLPSGETFVVTDPPRFDGENTGAISSTIPAKGVKRADLALRILLDDGVVLTEKDVDIRSPYPK